MFSSFIHVGAHIDALLDFIAEQYPVVRMYHVDFIDEHLASSQFGLLRIMQL